MPSTFNWLPPLGFDDGHQAHTTVEISQLDPCRFDESLRGLHITMSVEAYVEFVSENTDPSTRQENFGGLAIEESFNADNLAPINNEILRHFPYFGEQITWIEKHEDEEDPKLFELSSPDDAFRRIEKFLIETMEKEYNYGANVYSIELKILQEIVIPDEELKSWHLWYAAMEESYPDFKLEWANKTSHPRTEEELMNTSRVPERCLLSAGIQVVEVAQSCRICLDELSVGSTAIKLSCGHMFGDDCMKKWLQSSNTCPMCRSYVLRSSFEHLLL